MKSQKKSSWLFSFLIGMAVLTIGFASLFFIPAIDYAVYENKADGVRLKYPVNWKVIDHPAGGTMVVFIAAKQNAMDVTPAIANVAVQSLSSLNVRPERYTETVVRQITGTFGDAIEVLEDNSTRFAGRRGHRLMYVGKPKKELKESPMQYLHVWTVNATTAYVFTFAAKKDRFKSYQAAVNGMIKSFEILL